MTRDLDARVHSAAHVNFAARVNSAARVGPGGRGVRTGRRAALGVLAVSGVLAGCGGAGAMRPASGAALFAEACGACHSLVGRQTPTLQGGDLLDYRFGREAMREFAREMPVRRALDARQLTAVVEYVVRAEARGGAQ
ncbi:MAG TPA: cytochrome c [Solirubrobacteraceae bacterium]|nr:cytochrome c [Solirubrobacteraceae bacterium]